MAGLFGAKAFFTDFYGCRADLYQYPNGHTTRLTIYDPNGNVIIRKEYKTRRGAKIAMGKYGDCWRDATTGK